MKYLFFVVILVVIVRAARTPLQEELSPPSGGMEASMEDTLRQELRRMSKKKAKLAQELMLASRKNCSRGSLTLYRKCSWGKSATLESHFC